MTGQLLLLLRLDKKRREERGATQLHRGETVTIKPVYKARSARSADWSVLFMVWTNIGPIGQRGPEIPQQRAHKFREVITSSWMLVRSSPTHCLEPGQMNGRYNI